LISRQNGREPRTSDGIAFLGHQPSTMQKPDIHRRSFSLTVTKDQENYQKPSKTKSQHQKPSKTIKNHQKPCNSSIFCASIGAPSNHVKSLGTDGKTCKFSGQKKYRLKTLNSLGYGHNFMGQQMILNSYVVFLVNLNPKKTWVSEF
jgi:hypothetical protein